MEHVRGKEMEPQCDDVNCILARSQLLVKVLPGEESGLKSYLLRVLG